MLGDVIDSFEKLRGTMITFPADFVVILESSFDFVPMSEMFVHDGARVSYRMLSPEIFTFRSHRDVRRNGRHGRNVKIRPGESVDRLGG